MAYKSLHHFINKLEEQNELIRISAFVDPVLEIAEITDRMSKQPNGGKALLFENTGTSFPVLTNALGSINRICLALGVSGLDDVGSDINKLFAELAGPKTNIWEKLGTIPTLGKLSAWLPAQISSRGACQEVVHAEPNINLLPVMQCWPFDGGRFITLPMVNTKDPFTGIRNVGMYRMQVFDPKHTGMHWHQHKVGARHFEAYKKLGKRMPVAVALGGDPVYTYAATAPMPDNMDEYLLAGFLRKKKVKLVKCLTVDLEVPEDVDFVLEGFVDPTEELAWEGPFGDHTGFYSLADWYPRFHLTCITHRRDAVYPATLVGVPPMEDAYIAKATERIFLQPLRITMLPELEDLALPVEGTAHNIALVKFRDYYPGQAYKIMNAIWGAGQMMFNKLLVASPKDIDLTNADQILHSLVNFVDPERDLMFGKGPLDILDHATPTQAFGSKLFIDATNQTVVMPHLQISINDVKELLERETSRVKNFNLNLLNRGISILIISVDKQAVTNVKSYMQQLFRCQELAGLRAMVAVDMGDAVSDLSMLTWFASSNIDPIRDVFILNLNDGYPARVGVDGTRKAYPQDNFKREWPNVVAMSREMVDHVNKQWEKYGIGGMVESPSKQLLPLVAGEGPVVKLNS